MNPGKLDITLYRGTRFSITLVFTDAETGDPLDMTTYAPFKAEIRHVSRRTLIATISATLDEVDSNKVNLEVEPAITADLALTQNSPHKWGFLDSQSALWFAGSAKVEPSIPEYV